MSVARFANLYVFSFLAAIVLGRGALYGQTILGDDRVTVDILSPSMGAGISTQPMRSFRDEQGSYSIRSAGAAASIPLYEGGNDETRDRGYSVFLLHAQASVIQPEISVLTEQHSFSTGSLGSTYGIVTSSHNEYAITLQAGFAEDENTLHDARLRMAGFGTTHVNNDDALLVYGLAYSNTFDQGRLLPLLGLRWRFADNWNFDVLLPFSVEVKYRFTQDVTFGLGAHVHGNQFRFSDNQLSGGQSEVLNLKLTELQLGAYVRWKLMKDLLLNIETGIMAASHVYVTAGKGTLFSSRINQSPFLTLKLLFLLSDSLFPNENE